MALELRRECERRHAALAPHGDACIGTFECSCCTTCARALQHVGFNGEGELLRRPWPAGHVSMAVA